MARQKTALSVNMFDFLSDAVRSFESALETEADRRLYVTPPLTAIELLLLHVLHCARMATGRATLKQAAVSLEITEGYAAVIASKLRESAFLDELNVPTRSYGVPAVGVVQYVHGAWVEEYFSSLSSTEKTAALKKVDRQSFLPSALAETRAFLKSLEREAEKLDAPLTLEDAMLLVLIADHHKLEGRFANVRELSVLCRLKPDALYQRAQVLRKKGLLTRIDFDMTKKGFSASDTFRKAVEMRSVDIRARLLDS